MDLSDRMKRYEVVYRPKLMRRTPVIIRIDGKGFKTYTKDLNRPFDADFREAMIATTEHLVKNIQGALIGYTQSDEISILMSDTATLTTDAWFDNDLTKLCSVSASLATAFFNSYFVHPVHDVVAIFDSRAFNIPESEIVNYFVWRQQDAIRNSIQTVGQYHFKQNELHAKSVFQVKHLIENAGHLPWDEYDNKYKHGVVVQRKDNFGLSGIVTPIPIFSLDRDFITNLFTLYEPETQNE